MLTRLRGCDGKPWDSVDWQRVGSKTPILEMWISAAKPQSESPGFRRGFRGEYK